MKSRQSKNNWPIAYRWAAMGTLVAYSAVGSKTINVARAQDVRGLARAKSGIADAGLRNRSGASISPPDRSIPS